MAYEAVPLEMYEVLSDPGQDKEVDVDVAVAEVPVAVAEVVAEDVVVLGLPPAVSIVALMAYTLSLLGPPQSSVLLPPQTMLQSVAAAKELLGTKESPQ